MTVARLALIYSPWFLVTLAALVLTFRPGVYRSPRARSLAGALGVVELAYPVGVLLAPEWFVATVYAIPAVLALGSVALLAIGLVGFRRARLARRPGLASRVDVGGGDLPDAVQPGGVRTGGGRVALLAPERAGRLRPRERTAATRGVQYGILFGVLIILALTVDWDLISRQLFTLDAIREFGHRIFPDFLNTLKYTLSAFAISLSLGLVLALMKLSSAPLYRALATTYIEFFRGLPALIVVFAVAYGIPMALDVKIPGVTLKAAVALGCVSAAYMAESIRAGIQAVPKGQLEASRSLGMSHAAALRSVVIPQAFRIVLPPVTNEIILLTKDTSLVYVMGLATSEYELSKLARVSLAAPHGGLTALFAISACYLVITLPLGILVRRMEKGFGKAQA
ncbi:MAG: amino acid ABC transporter permease [Bifidobacteriaceae bacterium]|jgi:polar amino acid transport system permease protein|nr:amino acid ABC transporter permease [Bifidobacteriaceae bacterium]